MKLVARRYFEELMGRGDLAVADVILAAGLTVKGRPSSPQVFKDLAVSLGSAFPDWTNEIEAQYVDGETVITRVTARGAHQAPYLGIPATGRTAARSGILIFRVAEGRIIEIWDEIDQLGFLRHLAATLAPAAAPTHT